MTFEEYLKDVQRTLPVLTAPAMWENAALGIAAEGGEFANLLKKHMFQGHSFDIDKALEEGGDTLFYIGCLCLAGGITLEELAKRNVEKRLKRYPDGWDSTRSINRDE